MRFSMMLLLCASILASFQAWPQSEDPSTTRAKVLALEHAWNQAESMRDLRALDSIFDNGLTYVEENGALLTKADFLLQVKTRPVREIVTEAMDVEMFGGTAIVSGVYRASELRNGKTFIRRGRFVDTWIRKGSTWICVAAQSTPVLH